MSPNKDKTGLNLPKDYCLMIQYSTLQTFVNVFDEQKKMYVNLNNICLKNANFRSFICMSLETIIIIHF